MLSTVQETEVIAVRRYDDERIRITIRLRCEVPRTSPVWYQISNIIFKRFVIFVIVIVIATTVFMVLSS